MLFSLVFSPKGYLVLDTVHNIHLSKSLINQWHHQVCVDCEGRRGGGVGVGGD